MSLKVIILAAGQGTRMCSSLPKVLHTISEKPMLSWVIGAARSLDPTGIYIIYGHQGDRLREAYSFETDLTWVYQAEQLGTGHAVLQALPHIDDNDHVLILSGDVPMISQHSLKRLHEVAIEADLSLLLADCYDPSGLGRILRDTDSSDAIVGIVEEKDATPEQKLISEIYSGTMLIKAKLLKTLLPTLSNQNAQAEYYLTEVIALAAQQSCTITSYCVPFELEVQGVNTKLQQAIVERFHQRNQADRFMLQGLTLLDPQRFDSRGTLSFGQDCVVDVNVIFKGNVKLGAHCHIGPNCILENVTLGDNVEIKANSVIEDAIIDAHCTVGPFARIRPGTHLNEHAKIGNFVEVKKSTIGAHSKVSHLSYIGDATLGNDVNIGAGTITCNYDGVNKFQTVIENGAFIGSNTSLIAPIKIGEHAVVGAGTTLVKDAPAGALTINKREQRTIENWQRKK